MFARLIILCVSVLVHPQPTCTTNEDCTPPETCLPVVNVCGVVEQVECSPTCISPQICDPLSATCVTPSVPCAQDADCTASQVCNTSATPKTCVNPATCPACTHSQYCNTLTGQCVDCSGIGCFGTQYCATTGQCVSCSNPSCDIIGDPPEICTSTGCIVDPCGGECNLNDICGANGQCYDPKCGPGCASILCDQSSNTCICMEDTDCPTGKTCDKSTYACVDKSSAAHLYVPVIIAAFLLVFML